MTNTKETKDAKTRLDRRKAFKDWRKKKGISYQAIVSTVNAEAVKAGLCLAENPVLTYPTVASWGTRGAVPCPEAARALALVYRDIPIIKGLVIRP